MFSVSSVLFNVCVITVMFSFMFTVLSQLCLMSVNKCCHDASSDVIIYQILL